ncbi:MAG: 50S ribosomal protein L18 [Candidatus Omnitrophica bacterium]|nr:50S ribosomal protein L18 [Candidatus Omnitrophota bacterium]
MKKEGRRKRHIRITKKMRGTQDKPRLVVFRSKKHIYAQIINDQTCKVISGCSTLSKEFKEKNMKSADKAAAKEIGKLIARKVLSLGVKKICFDRAGYRYQGKVKTLADGVREEGVEF